MAKKPADRIRQLLIVPPFRVVEPGTLLSYYCIHEVKSKVLHAG